MIAPASAALLVSIARCSAFAAAMPLASAGAVPRIVRAGLALALTPLVAARLSLPQNCCHGSILVAHAVFGALTGAVYGLAATVVAGAAAAAGGIIDAALAAGPTGRESLFGAGAGPFGRLYPLAFALVFFSSGACMRLIERFVETSTSLGGGFFSPSAVAAIGAACIRAALALAGPAICAQLLAAVIAAALTRITPTVNGMLLATPLAGGLTLVVTLAGVAALFPHLVGLSASAVRAAAMR